MARARSRRIALAVSGGSDSMALMHLVHRAGIDFEVVSVDHGLRAEATDEIAHVAHHARAIGVAHHVLTIDLAQSGNMMSVARDGRYHALGDYAQENGIDEIWLGHTLDDQVEGFWMRAYRGSGAAGLAPMAREFMRDGVRFFRPLLDYQRDELRAFLGGIAVTWCDDPSNENPEFDRARLRPIVQSAEAAGFAPDRLRRTMDNLARIDAMAHRMTVAFLRKHVDIAPMNIECKIDRAAFLKLDEEIALRVLSQITTYYAMAVYPPRLSAVSHICQAIHNQTGGATLDGCEWQWSARKIKAYPEFNALPAPSNGAWYLYTFKSGDARIRALGEDRHAVDVWNTWGIGAKAARALPAICVDVDGVATPIVDPAAIAVKPTPWAKQ